MRYIFSIVFFVAALDGLVAAFFAWPVAGGTIFLVGITASIALLFLKKPQEANNNSWLLGRAIEITNPDHPKKENAYLTLGALKQGILCFGQSGSGKTESFCLGFIEYVRKKLNTGIAYFDGKGDLDTVKKFIAVSGAPDHFFSSELDNSGTINLMEGDPQDVIDRLSHLLIGSTSSTTFYSDEQYAALTRLVPLLLSTGVPASLRDLYVILTNEDAGFELIRRAEKYGADADVINLGKEWLNTPAKDRLRNISGLLTRLFVYVAGPKSDRLNDYSPTITISKLVGQGETVYFHLPYTIFSINVAIAIMEMFAVEARKRQLTEGSDSGLYPLLFDDWGKFIHSNFSPFMSRCRSANMPAAFSFQSVGQIKEVSPLFIEQMDDLAATKIFLRVQGESTIDFASRLLGYFETTDVNTSVNSSGRSGSMHTVRTPRVEPRTLRELTEGEAIISTHIKTNEGNRNPYWRVSLPLPDFGEWESIPLPVVTTSGDGEGLRLWDRYFNPAKLKEIQAEIEIAVKEEAAAVKSKHESIKKAESERLETNPGLGSPWAEQS